MKKLSARLISTVMALVVCLSMFPAASATEESVTDTASDSITYLSDIDYSSASIGWGVIHLDGNMNDEPISLYVDGNRIYFDKGITAHASSTIVYDLTGYEQYNYFTSYIGVDASQGTKGNVIFHIYTSPDGSSWNEVYTSGELTAGSESEFVSIDISNAKYLKLFTDSNGGNGNDHSAFADAKLSINEYGTDIVCNGLKTLEEYDALLADYRSGSNDYAALLQNSEFEKTLLQRTFVKNAGYKSLYIICSRDEKYVEILEWLLNNEEALSLYILGGEPSGTYQKSLDVLYDLLQAHGDDINDSEHGDLYLKMIITLSLTHSESVYFWEDINQVSDPVYRYEIYKDMYLDGLLWTDIFENLTVEEMRWVLNNQLNDNEIRALNTYVRENNSLSEFTYENWCTINGYNYITYTLDYHYPENPSIFDIFEQGAVCGGISKSSVNIRQVFGIPGATLHQPGHCAWLDYRYSYTDSCWYIYIGNDVSGWTESSREEDRRMPCAWGNNSWRTDSRNASYSLLSQRALNDFENYTVAEELVAMSYAFPNEAEEIIRTALGYQDYNLDVYYALIMSKSNCSESEYTELLQTIADNMYAYPLPMWDLLNLAKTSCNVNSDTAIAEFLFISSDALTRSAVITAEETLQPAVSKIMANFILSNHSLELADFSLDGENADVLQLVSGFSDSVVMEYSLDGGASWKSANGASVTLSDTELSKITAENDILVRLKGMDKYFTIDISKFDSPSNLYNNDLENRVINATDDMEWSYDQAVWTSFADSEPDLTGDKTVYVRYTTSGTSFASDEVELSYTEDEVDITKSYISLDRISVIDCSTEAAAHGEYAYKAIDGDINTYWHTSWTYDSDTERYIVFELDDYTYLSAMDYVPRQDSGTNGKFTSCEVYTSLDGEEWTLAASASGWALDKATKTVEFEESVYAKYIKVVATEAYNNFASAAMINFYEDLSGELFGDVDLNGDINIDDGTTIQLYCADLITLTDEQKRMADVDGNGAVTIDDATYIQMYCASFISSFPVTSALATN